MTDKIIIIGPHNIDKLSLAKHIVELNDNLSIGEHFTNDSEYKNNENDNYIYYLDSQEIDLAYKNNVILSIDTQNYISYGIMMDNFYNNDIFEMSLKEFNNMSNTAFNSKSYDIIVVWVDGPIVGNDKLTKEDINESKYIIDRINNGIKLMYFINESFEDISNVIIEYLNASEERKAEILEENS